MEPRFRPGLFAYRPMEVTASPPDPVRPESLTCNGLVVSTAAKLSPRFEIPHSVGAAPIEDVADGTCQSKAANFIPDRRELASGPTEARNDRA